MFLKRVPLPHKCQPPSIDLVGEGSVWQCDECKTIYELKSIDENFELDVPEDKYWEHIEKYPPEEKHD
jgi:hypothetical protein